MKINMTHAQAKVVETLEAPAIVPTKEGVTGTLYVYDIPGDDSVTLYVIRPDGGYHTEALENGLGQGWIARDSEGNEIV